MINRTLIQLFIASFSLLVIAMGATVIRGWLIQDSAIVQVRPEYAPMQFNTALCFILTGLATWTLLARRWRLCLPISLATLLFTALSGIQYALDIDLGIDTLFVDPFTTVKTSHAGRMAPNTALNFFLLNAAIVFACSPASPRSKSIASIAIGLIAFAFALVALLGYGAGLEGALIWGNFTAMAVHTAIGFMLLSTALVLIGIHHSEIKNFYEIPWLPQAASISVAVLTVLMWIALQTGTSAYIRNLLNNHDDELAGIISSYLQLEGLAIKRMAGRMDLYEQNNLTLFSHDAETYLEDFHELAGLAWVRADGNLVYQKIEGQRQGNAALSAAFIAGLQRAETAGDVKFDSPTDTDRHEYFRISVGTAIDQTITGQLVGLSSAKELMARVLQDYSPEDYVVSVTMNGHQLIAPSRAADPRWSSQGEFQLGDISLDIVVQASPLLVQKQQNNIPTIFLITGLLMSFLIGTTLRLFQASRALTMRISETNAQLHESLQETEKSKKALVEKSAALEQSNRDLENFASIASHDLKEPLRKISMFGERLQQHSGEHLDDKGQQYLEVMINGAQRMQTLLNTLLAYSRITTRGGEFAETDLKAVLHDVCEDLEEVIRENQAEIHIADLPVITADYTQMRQLFQNLVANSMRYHKPDKAPVISIQLDPQNAPAGFMRIVVRDNGIGFEQENADKIFEVFKRLHSKTEFPGTGMGLAVCKRIMERHQGRISAQGEPNVGASFLLDFPLN